MDMRKEHVGLINAIENRRAVLFLGSGANYSCKHVDDKDKFPPMGDALRDEICDRFLGGNLKQETLASVSEYAISDTSLPEVQKFIKDLFTGYLPCEGHKIVTTLSWAGIVTTNYDALLEAAYSEGHNNQKLQPIVSNNDSMVELLKSTDALAYLKLHGCMTKIDITDPPLILSNDQYSDFEKGRESLFDTLKE
jgi:hypothetical protein